MQPGSPVFDRILSTQAPLLTLETGERTTLIEQFRQKVRYTGQAVYLWRPGDGLCSLRETGIRVPGCLRLGDTLRYILMSVHFGIYLIDEPGLSLTRSDLLLLRRIASVHTDFVRRVVLLCEGPELTQRLGELAVPLKHEHATQAQLRLRGGRWVR